MINRVTMVIIWWECDVYNDDDCDYVYLFFTRHFSHMF